MLLHVYQEPAIRGRRVVVNRGEPKGRLPKQILFAGKSMSIEPVLRLNQVPRAVRWANRKQRRESIVLGLSEQVRTELRLPEETQLRGRLRNDTWELGPCLGIYIRTTKSVKHPFGEQSRLLAEMAKMASRNGVDLVVMGPGFLRNQRGWRLRKDDASWVEQDLPIPDIVYRRSGAFTSDDAQMVLEDLRAFTRKGLLHTLPRNYSNKWKLHQILCRNESLHPYLLKTELITRGEDLYRTATVQKDVYVKPLTGAQGHSIFRIYGTSDGLKVSWERPRSGLQRRDVLTRVFKTQKAFLNFWRASGPRRVIVQETFALPRSTKGEPFDFRWLVQYVDGSPEVIARVGRMGNSGSITTNIHTGAKPVEAEQLLDQEGWTDTDSLLQRIDKVAVAVVEECRKAYGPIVELGVDLAVSADGEIRVFEVNSTPGRRMLRLLSSELREMSLQYLLEYAINATGFAGES